MVWIGRSREIKEGWRRMRWSGGSGGGGGRESHRQEMGSKLKNWIELLSGRLWFVFVDDSTAYKERKGGEEGE